MQPIFRYATLALLSLLFRSALAQVDSTSTFGLEPGEHAVGFRLLEDDDRSRAVTGGSRGAVHPRPIRIYLWYPAQTSRRSQPLRFGRYAALADEDVWPSEIAGELRERLKYSNGPLARSLPAPSFAALLERPMRAVENAEPVAGPFPLIVIGLGLYYESPDHVRGDGGVSRGPRFRRGDGAARRNAHRARETQRAGSRDADSRPRVRHCARAAIPVRRSGAARRAGLRPGRHGRRRAHDAQPRRRRVRQLGLGHPISARVGTAAHVAAL